MVTDITQVQLKEMAHIMAQASGAQKVILFGSRARGDFDHLSDWDFLLLLPEGAWMQSFESELDVVRATHMALLEAGFDVSIDIVPMSENHYQQGNSVLAQVAQKEGKTLLEAGVYA
jgi:predicted nucleotidyltransferase